MQTGVTPKRQNTSSLPFEPTEITRWTLEALREAAEPIITRDVTDKLVARNGLDASENELVARIRHSVDAILRSMKQRNYVDNTDDCPAHWFILVDDLKPLRRRGPGPSTRSDLEDGD